MFFWCFPLWTHIRLGWVLSGSWKEALLLCCWHGAWAQALGVDTGWAVGNSMKLVGYSRPYRPPVSGALHPIGVFFSNHALIFVKYFLTWELCSAPLHPLPSSLHIRSLSLTFCQKLCFLMLSRLHLICSACFRHCKFLVFKSPKVT